MTITHRDHPIRGGAVFRWGVALMAWAAVVAGALAQTGPTYRPQLKLPIEQRQPLIVGAVDDSYPYSYYDSEGRLTGFAVELSDAVARTMHLKIQRVTMRGRDLHDRFQAGEFDFLQAYSDSPTREGFAAFSVPFLTLQGTLFVQKRDSPIRTLADFNGRDFAIIGAGGPPSKDPAAAPSRPGVDGHAGEGEISNVMASRPDLAHPERSATESGADLNRLDLPAGVYTGIWWYAKFPNHYAGDSSAANAARGEAATKATAENIANAIRAIKSDQVAPRLQREFFEKAQHPLETKQ